MTSYSRRLGALIHTKSFESQAYPVSISRQGGYIYDRKLNVARVGTSIPASNCPYCQIIGTFLPRQKALPWAELKYISGVSMEQWLLSQQLRSGPSVLKNRESNFFEQSSCCVTWPEGWRIISDPFHLLGKAMASESQISLYCFWDPNRYFSVPLWLY